MVDIREIVHVSKEDLDITGEDLINKISLLLSQKWDNFKTAQKFLLKKKTVSENLALHKISALLNN